MMDPKFHSKFASFSQYQIIRESLVQILSKYSKSFHALKINLNTIKPYYSQPWIPSQKIKASLPHLDNLLKQASHLQHTSTPQLDIFVNWINLIFNQEFTMQENHELPLPNITTQYLMDFLARWEYNLTHEDASSTKKLSFMDILLVQILSSILQLNECSSVLRMSHEDYYEDPDSFQQFYSTEEEKYREGNKSSLDCGNNILQYKSVKEEQVSNLLKNRYSPPEDEKVYEIYDEDYF